MRTLEQTVSKFGDPLALNELRDLDGRAVVAARWRHGSNHCEMPPSDVLRVVLNLAGVHTVCLKRCGQVTRFSGVPGFVGILPSGEPSESAIEGYADTVIIFLPLGDLGHPAGGWPALPPVAVADEAVRAAAVATFVAARTGDGPRSRRAATVLRRTACDLLLSQAQPVRPHKGGLPPTARRRVEHLIEQHLDTPQGSLTGVGALAAEAGLSVNHFIRAFRQVTGATPHQHVMARRQQRAMALLGEPALSVADVADQLGFSSPAHFVASFRQRLGVTPGEYREAVLTPCVQAGMPGQ